MKTLFTVVMALIMASAYQVNGQVSKSREQANIAQKKKEEENKAAIKKRAADLEAAAKKKRDEERAAAIKKKEEENKAAVKKRTTQEVTVADKQRKASVAKKSSLREESTSVMEEQIESTKTLRLLESSVSPNPLVSGNGKIVVDGFTNTVGKLTIVNSGGETVLQRDVLNGEASFESVASGLYIYKVTSVEGDLIAKGKFYVY